MCSKNAETDCVECDWCGEWVHRECAALSEEELKVLCSINTNVKFFCEVCNPKVEVAFHFFNDVLKKQDIIDSKIKTISSGLICGIPYVNILGALPGN